MSNSTDRQFQQADAAVDQAVTALTSNIESMFGKWQAVAPAYIIERLAVELCAEMSRLLDDPSVRNSAGLATIKLPNALADYRDSRGEEH